MAAGVVITGLDPIITRSKEFKRELASEIRKAQAIVRKSIVSQRTVEPPPPPNSTYQRTGQLSRGWERAVPILTNDGTIMQLINSVTYMPFVQDADEQAAVHQDRWETNQQIADDNEGAAQQAFEDASARACAWVEKG